MSEVTLKINHRGYSMSCDAGQEQRLADLSHYVDSRLQDIKASGAASTEAHLLVLTSLVLADEVFELREELKAIRSGLKQPESTAALDPQEEAIIVQAIEHLAGRVEGIASRIQKAEAA